MDLLSPSTSVVMNILENNYSSKNLTTALTDLTEQGIIRKLDNQNSLRIAEHTDVNIDELIKDKIFQRKTLFNLEDTPLFPARGKQGNPSLSPAYFRTSRKTAVKPPIFRVCGQIQRVFSKPPDAELLRATVSAVARNTAPMLP